MPIATVQTFVKSKLHGLDLPLGLGRLQAFITPPNPRDDAAPGAYVWGGHGTESRLTVPRAQWSQLATGGNKQIAHQVDVFLTWFQTTEDPNVDLQFPSIIDTVLATLRNMVLVDTPAQVQHLRDPVTGRLSQLLDFGETLSWEYGPTRALADQRTFRFDARITVSGNEVIQS